MCGISGVFQIIKKNNDCDFFLLENILNNLINSVALRGPDNQGKIKVSCGFLGHTRLSIRDLSGFSNQPILLKDERSAFVYNGEIYNHNEILNQYLLPNINSDTLCLKSLFNLKEDISFINDLIGDFAIGYWNDREKKLFLIRDHLGKKPIYYTQYKDYFLFNSSIKGLQDVIRSKTIDNNSFINYLFYGNMFDEKTLFHEIKQVLPGQILTWDSKNGAISTSKYFKLEDLITNSSYINLRYKDLTNLFSEKLKEVVSSHLYSDVPISILLSSGIDSKAVARYSLSENIMAYTADFETNNKEVEDAELFCKNYSQIEHKIINVNNFKVFEILEKIINFIGEPFADPSVVPLYALYSSLPNNSKVILQGDGGDELFGGYKRYYSYEYLSKFPKLNKVYDLISSKIKSHRLERILYLSTLNQSELYKNIMTTDFKSFNTISFFKNYFKNKKLDIENIFGNSYERDFNITPNTNLQEKLSHIDFINQLPNQFLYKVDRTSMICGVEARVPLVDLRLLKFIFSVNPRYRFKRNPEKKFLRDSVDIPPQYKNNRKKGFGTPISTWMINSKFYLKKMLLDKDFLEFFMLEKEELNNVINMNKFSASESYCLWKILCLSIWFNNVFKK